MSEDLSHDIELDENATKLVGFCSFIGKDFHGFQRQVLKGVNLKTV